LNSEEEENNFLHKVKLDSNKKLLFAIFLLDGGFPFCFFFISSIKERRKFDSIPKDTEHPEEGGHD